jgi:hypothetical protein
MGNPARRRKDSCSFDDFPRRTSCRIFAIRSPVKTVEPSLPPRHGSTTALGREGPFEPTGPSVCQVVCGVSPRSTSLLLHRASNRRVRSYRCLYECQIPAFEVGPLLACLIHSGICAVESTWSSCLPLGEDRQLVQVFGEPCGLFGQMHETVLYHAGLGVHEARSMYSPSRFWDQPRQAAG